MRAGFGATLRSNHKPERAQPGPDLIDMFGHLTFGRFRGATSLGGFTKLGRWEKLARSRRVLVFAMEDT